MAAHLIPTWILTRLTQAEEEQKEEGVKEMGTNMCPLLGKEDKKKKEWYVEKDEQTNCAEGEQCQSLPAWPGL